MSKGFYIKLSVQNIKKNGKIYIPYFLMCSFMTAMYYIIYALSINEGMKKMAGGSNMSQMLGVGCGIVAFFALVFLFYINSFLMKRRKKEFGLYSILGMEKRHLGRVVFWENTVIAVASMAMGILLGILLNKLVYLGVVNLFQSEVPLGFEIAPQAMGAVLEWFGLIHLLIFLNGTRQILIVKPIELLHGGNVGEREPKVKIVLALLGFLCLASGYYLAVTTTNPVAALIILMVAIILVMIGTYLTFTAGSIALLKILRKNKNYYYKTKHFISVSGMIYRMKQNAVGLANIAILSTGVLLMISTTLSLYTDMNNIIDTRYPRDILVTKYDVQNSSEDPTPQILEQAAEETGVETRDFYQYGYLGIGAFIEENRLITEKASIYQVSLDTTNVVNLLIVTLEDYNRMIGTEKQLEDGEILLYTNRKGYTESEIELLGQTFSVKEQVKDFVQDSNMSSNVVDSMVLIVKDQTVQAELGKLQEQVEEDSSRYNRYYGINVSGGSEEKQAYLESVQRRMKESTEAYRVEDRESGRKDFLGTYSGLFFIGIFLSLLFIVATVLIIYYKQISEGYDDRGKFDIMQKVGLDKREIRRSINSQVLTVFFLPLVTAGIHTAFAFPIMRRLMLMLNLTNTRLYLIVTGICFLVFAVLYGVVYQLTARVYYKIVSA